MDYYLIPDLRRISSRDLMLVCFYADDIYVPDGLVYWSFLREGLTVLSHCSRDQQVALLNDVARSGTAPAKTLRTYAELVQSSRIKHGWFGGSQWELAAPPESDILLPAKLRKLSQAFRDLRPEVAREVRSLLLSDPTRTPSEAIAVARRAVFAKCFAKASSTDQRLGELTQQVAKAFDSHEEEYLTAERAIEGNLDSVEQKTSYAGALADVIGDLRLNPEFCPIFASPQISSVINRQAFSERNTGRADAALEFLLGISLLQTIPSIKFRDVDHMLEMRHKYRSAIRSYNLWMGETARDMARSSYDEDLISLVGRKIEKDLLPAIRELREIRNKYEERTYPAEQTLVVGGAAQIILGAATAQLPVVVSGIITALSGGGVWAAHEMRDKMRMNKSISRTGYKGLSLTLDLET